MAPATAIVDIHCSVKTVRWPHETNIIVAIYSTCYMGGYKIVTPWVQYGPPWWTTPVDQLHGSPYRPPQKVIIFHVRCIFPSICTWTNLSPNLHLLQKNSLVDTHADSFRHEHLAKHTSYEIFKGVCRGVHGAGLLRGGPPGWSMDQKSVFCTHPLLY